MARARISPASKQIVDSASNTQTINAASFAGFAANGTIFPLLPFTGVRLYNVSAFIEAITTPNKLAANSISIFISFLDATQNVIDTGAGTLIDPVLAQTCLSGQGMLLGTFSGLNCVADGDPLMEITAGLDITGYSSAQQGVQFFQLSANADVTNTDAANSHQATLTLNALLSFFPRGGP